MPVEATTYSPTASTTLELVSGHDWFCSNCGLLHMLSVWWFGQAGKWGGFLSQKEKESPRQEKEKSNNRKRGKRERAKEGRRRRMHQASMPNEMTGTARPQAVMLKKQIAQEHDFQKLTHVQSIQHHQRADEIKAGAPQAFKEAAWVWFRVVFIRAEGRREEEQNHSLRKKSKLPRCWLKRMGWSNLTLEFWFDKRYTSARVEPNRAQRTLVFLGVLWPKQMMLVASSGYLFNAQVRLC